jgi:leader peptidase (prepilin peptidase)/N-methyltransferase
MELVDSLNAAALVVAPFLGSFLAVIADRVPRQESVVVGRSRCRACSTTLGPGALVPIVSWLVQRGRCRSCGAPIDWLLPALEIGALAVAVWAWFVFHGWLLAASCALGWTLLTLAAIDARWQILPDRLTLPLIPAGLGVLWLIDPDSLADHALATGAGGTAFALIGWAYRRIRHRGGLGFGDAKLLAAAGAWVGIPGLPTVVLYASLAAIAAAVTMPVFGRRVTAESRIAFGPYLCASLWLVWLYGPLTFAFRA